MFFEALLWKSPLKASDINAIIQKQFKIVKSFRNYINNIYEAFPKETPKNNIFEDLKRIEAILPKPIIRNLAVRTIAYFFSDQLANTLNQNSSSEQINDLIVDVIALSQIDNLTPEEMVQGILAGIQEAQNTFSTRDIINLLSDVINLLDESNASIITTVVAKIIESNPNDFLDLLAPYNTPNIRSSNDSLEKVIQNIIGNAISLPKFSGFNDDFAFWFGPSELIGPEFPISLVNDGISLQVGSNTFSLVESPSKIQKGTFLLFSNEINQDQFLLIQYNGNVLNNSNEIKISLNQWLNIDPVELYLHSYSSLYEALNALGAFLKGPFYLDVGNFTLNQKLSYLLGELIGFSFPIFNFSGLTSLQTIKSNNPTLDLLCPIGVPGIRPDNTTLLGDVILSLKKAIGSVTLTGPIDLENSNFTFIGAPSVLVGKTIQSLDADEYFETLNLNVEDILFSFSVPHRMLHPNNLLMFNNQSYGVIYILYSGGSLLAGEGIYAALNQWLQNFSPSTFSISCQDLFSVLNQVSYLCAQGDLNNGQNFSQKLLKVVKDLGSIIS